MQTFWIKRGDLLPSIQATLKDASGIAVDLSGAESVEFHLWLEGEVARVCQPAAIVTAASGVVRYDWGLGDTDVAGEYNAEWEVTYLDGKQATWPNSENDLVVITADALEPTTP